MKITNKNSKAVALGFTLFEMVVALFVITVLALIVVKGSANLKMSAHQKEIDSTMELIRQEILDYIITREQVAYDNVTEVGTGLVAGDTAGFTSKPGFLQDIIKKYSKIDTNRVAIRAYPYNIDYKTANNRIFLVSKRQICNSAPYTKDDNYQAEDAVFKDFYNAPGQTRVNNPRATVKESVVLEILYLTNGDDLASGEYTASKFITLQDLLKAFDCGGGNRTRIITETLPPMVLWETYKTSIHLYTPYKSSSIYAENDVTACIEIEGVGQYFVAEVNRWVTFSNIPIVSGGSRASGIFSVDCSVSPYISIQGNSTTDFRDRAITLNFQSAVSVHFAAANLPPPDYLVMRLYVKEGKDDMLQTKEYLIPIKHSR